MKNGAIKVRMCGVHVSLESRRATGDYHECIYITMIASLLSKINMTDKHHRLLKDIFCKLWSFIIDIDFKGCINFGTDLE